MNRITVGKARGKLKIQDNGKTPEPMKFGEDAVTAIGLCAVCLMLLVPVSRDLPEPSDAVAVMSTGVEQLREIDEPALYQPEEDSIFDYIGRMFAGLLFGE